MPADEEERYDRLVATLAELTELLRRTGDRWADSVDLSRAEIERGDTHGLARFLGTFGGVGSFTDVVIHPLNGHPVAESEVPSVNREFQRLKSAAWTDAAYLERELDRS